MTTSRVLEGSCWYQLMPADPCAAPGPTQLPQDPVPACIPEAITAGFLDTAQHGSPTVDWLSFTEAAFKRLDESEKPEVDYTKTPPAPSPAKANSAYTGTYNNSYYGPLAVVQEGGKLAMRMGPPG
jgi:hypothetical protein